MTPTSDPGSPSETRGDEVQADILSYEGNLHLSRGMPAEPEIRGAIKAVRTSCAGKALT